jgi:hypothetical protein
VQPWRRLVDRAQALLIALLFVGASCEEPAKPPADAVPVFRSPEDVVAGLARAYQRRDLELFELLLADDKTRNAEFVFRSMEFVETEWGRDEELRIHRRMFLPQNEGLDPVPAELWIQSIDIELQQRGSFSEMTDLTDLYSAVEGRDGKLDPGIWRALAALYSTDLSFRTAGEADYVSRGGARFVVIEDRTKKMGERGKFLLLVWEDLCGSLLSPALRSSEQICWGRVKALYL